MGSVSIDLPGALRLTPSFPFVGRSLERATLRTLLPRIAGEARRVALVAGEAGSGKSRLVREHANEMHGAGAIVLYGACDMTHGAPYQPFVEALSHLAREAEPTWLRTALGSTGDELLRLLPDLGERVGKLQPPSPADPDTERHRLHIAVTNLFEKISRDTGVLLVVEDLHWADPATLQLLRHLVRAGAEARMLVVVTFRDDAQEPGAGLRETLADLARAEGVTRLRLNGLADDEVVQFVRAASGVDGGATATSIADRIAGLTRGNPFLVVELWRALVETGTVTTDESGELQLVRPLDELASPDTVREVVSERVARLDAATRTLLELAAVLGPEFELRVLARAAEFDEAELRVALDGAVRSGMIQDVPPFGLSFRFTHELVRRALVDACTPVRRAELHLSAGRALEELYPDPPPAVLSELAHHLAASTSIGDPERAVDYTLRAGRAASTSLAYEEAAERFRTALALGIDDDRRRASVELDLARVLNWAGGTHEAIMRFKSAVEIARRIEDAELLALAAVGLEEACWRPGITDQGAEHVLREALAELPEDQAALRVRLLGGLARALRLLGRSAEGRTIWAQALELARAVGDERLVANVLIQGYWAAGGAGGDEVLGWLAEARQIAERHREMTIRAEAMAWRVVTLVAIGELSTARKELDVLRSAAERTRQPFVLHAAETFGSALALCEGRLADAEEMAERGQELGRLLRGADLLGPDASGTYGLQLFNIRREQGRLAELAPVVRLIAEGADKVTAWRPGLIVLLAELGMVEQARAELHSAGERGLSEIARDALWIAALAYLADASAVLADRPTASLVYRELEPLQGRPLVVGHLVACFGATDRYLAKLAATFGERPLAERHFETALEVDGQMGARLWLAHTRYEYARVLQAGDDSDRSRAAELLALASEEAGALGLRALAAKIEALGPAARSHAGVRDDLSPREVVVLRLVARGLGNREIGRELVISEHTVANHIRSILRKTSCANRTEATAYAYRHGLAAGDEPVLTG